MKTAAEQALSLLMDNKLAGVGEIITGIDPLMIKAKYDKDLDRIKAFIQAGISKIVTEAITVTDLLEDPTLKTANAKIDSLKLFIADFYSVVALYLTAAESVKKFQFPKDLWSGKFKDPFKDCREAARKVNLKWGLGVSL